MGERRTTRGIDRTDAQILSHHDDVEMLLAIGRGSVVVDSGNRMQFKRLIREELCLAGFGTGAAATLLPRGQRIVATIRGELPAPFDD